MQINTSLNSFPYFIFFVFMSFNITSCSEEKKDVRSTINNLITVTEKTYQHEDSKFEKVCINKINSNVKSGSYEKMSAKRQLIMTRIFNECVNSLKKELLLTEKEYENPEKNKLCYEGVKELRNSIPEIKTEIQKFKNLPNKTEEDSMNVSLSFSFLSSEIITKGGSAMLNRTLACAIALN